MKLTDLLWSTLGPKGKRWMELDPSDFLLQVNSHKYIIFAPPKTAISNLISSKYYINHIKAPPVSLKPHAMWALIVGQTKSSQIKLKQEKDSSWFKIDIFVQTTLLFTLISTKDAPQKVRKQFKSKTDIQGRVSIFLNSTCLFSSDLLLGELSVSFFLFPKLWESCHITQQHPLDTELVHYRSI